MYAREDVYRGPQLGEAPDLIVGYYPGYRASWQTALGAAPAGDALVDNEEAWSGGHLVDAPSVPGIYLSTIGSCPANPRLIDIAPTVLKCFGVEPPGEMDGKPLF